jgi:two-component system sensor histidine kinase HydH
MPSPSSPPAERTLIEAVAAGIAHEVRNPLNALQINLRILEQELREVLHDPSLHVFVVLGKIADELRSLDDFVTEFLRYARPPKLKTEAVRIGTLLSDLATFIAPECAKKGATLSVRAGDGTIQADSFQLKHALLNLVLNALQATPRGGTITIESGESGKNLAIEVHDTGEGIPSEILDRVFEVFFTTREGGTGLGLPIAQRIVEEHGGTLEVSSRAGKGTTLKILLPLHAGAR